MWLCSSPAACSIGRHSSGLDDEGVAALAAAASLSPAPSAAVPTAPDGDDHEDDIPNRYFVFQGIRFVADDLSARVRRARLTVGTTTADFHAVAAAGGLSHAEVARRMAERLGLIRLQPRSLIDW